ncbi:universal stress protein [Terrabacter sp. NPDC080008]|uniref:universal stress protein n=1 Tax=Terrabacter sp. NPDC080008 TaxID=3155176 RepID=UPI00344B7625
MNVANLGKPHRIVVGVSPTSGSPGALRWAVEEAAVRGGHVLAVRAWRAHMPETATGGRLPSVVSDDTTLAAEQARLAEDVVRVLGPDHVVDTRVIPGKRRAVLIEESRTADLLVIDAGHSTEVGARWLGSRLVRAAHCPVVVVPPALGELPPRTVGLAADRFERSVERAAATAGRPGFQRPPSG